MSEIMYMHSRCCMKEWKLVVKDEKYKLECEGCGMDSGVDFTNDPSEEIPKCCNGLITFMLKDGEFKSICEKCEKEIPLKTDFEPPEHVACACCTDGETIH